MDKIESALAVVSGAPTDEQVISVARDLTRHCKGRVWALYVIEVPPTLPVDAETPAATALGEAVLERMEERGRALKTKVEGYILQARDTGAAVVREAVERGADVTVIGMPCAERYGSPSLGETVPYLLRHSPNRVVVCRDRQPEPEGA